ncbi:MAG: RnfABCDGE type electron transport complex subunit D [Desulfatibacillaceae bacterium]
MAEKKNAPEPALPAYHPFSWLPRLGFDRERLPKKLFMIQPMMMKVIYGLLPALLGAVYFFGYRVLVVTAVVLLAGVISEGLFTLRNKKPITSAIFVTSLIFTLSLPPGIPIWMAVVGIVFGTIFGKMVFGGFGHNVYNPAMVGRCFIYISFPIALTNRWVEPLAGGVGGLASWQADAVTTATPLTRFAAGESVPLSDLFWGNVTGSMGETSAILLILGGIYIIWTRSAPWRIALSFFLGGLAASGLLFVMGVPNVPNPVFYLLAGSFLFGGFFVATEPISGPRSKELHWVYGGLLGILVVILRRYSNFPEGVMFAVLFMNTFVPVADQGVRNLKQKRSGK